LTGKKRNRIFAARKRGKKKREWSGKKEEKQTLKNKKNKVCETEKGFYLCSPKRKGRRKANNRKRFPGKKMKSERC